MAEISQHIILRISEEKTVQLIELYRREECLWNKSLEEYKYKARRQEATERIARELNIPHFQASHVTIKLRNLRNSYCQELKKARKDTYKPKVFWFHSMDFIRPYLQPTTKWLESSGESLRDNDVNVKTENEIDWGHLSNPDDECPEENCDGSEADFGLVSTKRSRCSSESSKRLRTDESFDKDNPIEQSMRDVAEQLRHMVHQKDDCFDIFGKYVASMLRSMSMQKALELQPKVVNLLVSGVMNADSNVSQSDETANIGLPTSSSQT